MKDNPSNGRKYSQIIYLIRNCIQNIYKGLLQLNNGKTTQFLTWAKDLNRPFSKEDTQVDNKHMNKYSTLLITGKMQIKTMRYFFTLTKIAKNQKMNKCCQRCGEIVSPQNSQEDCGMMQPLLKTVQQLNISLPYHQHFHFYIYTQER